jgi:uncharacterized protein YuzE
MAKLPITWDDVAKAGYVYLYVGEERRVEKTVEVHGDGRFLLDLDPKGRVLGIEFLSDVPVSALMSVADRYATKFRGEIVTDW